MGEKTGDNLAVRFLHLSLQFCISRPSIENGPPQVARQTCVQKGDIFGCLDLSNPSCVASWII